MTKMSLRGVVVVVVGERCVERGGGQERDRKNSRQRLGHDEFEGGNRPNGVSEAR